MKHFYTYTFSLVLTFFLVATNVTAQWNSNTTINTPVQIITSMTAPQMAPDGSGGTYIVWTDSRGGSHIYAQHLNSAGVALWTTDGIAICNSSSGNASLYDQLNPSIVADGSGGAIIAWQDIRDNRFLAAGNSNTAMYSIYAQKVNAAGTIQWTANGALVATSTNDCLNKPFLATDASGGAFVAYSGHLFTNNNNAGYEDHYIQRINSAGTVWASPVTLQYDHAMVTLYPGPRDMGLVEDGSGGAYVQYFYGAYEAASIYLNHVTSTGTTWASPTQLTASGSNSNVPSTKTLAQDGSGGVISTYLSNGSIKAQRVNSSGTTQWTALGVNLSPTYSTNNSTVSIVTNGSGGAFFSWMNYRTNNWQVYAQQITSAGAIAAGWGTDGNLVNTAAAIDMLWPVMVSDGTNGAIIAWQDSRSGNDVYAQHMNSAGTKVWTNTGNGDGVAIGTNAASQGSPAITTNGSNGALISFPDNRNSIYYTTLYAQNVNADGTVGPPCIAPTAATLSATNTSICNGASTTISLTGTLNSATAWQWYTASCGGTSAGSGTSITVSPTTTTTYYARGEGGCVVPGTCASITITVNPLPSATITPSGATTFCTGGSVTLSAPSTTNNAISIAGGGYVTVPHSSSINISAGTTYSIEAWVYVTDNVNNTIVDKGDYDFLFQTHSNGNTGLGLYNRNFGWVYSAGTTPTNQWVHVAVTYNNQSVAFYQNGTLLSTHTTSAVSVGDTGPVNIGRQSPISCACNIFNGNMDELRLWNVARTQAQIAASMNSSIPANSAGLAAYYKFNEGTGTSVSDVTSNANNGTFTNTLSWQVPSTAPISNLAYSWSTGATTSSILASTSNTYTVTVTDGNSCTASSSQVVTATPNNTITLSSAVGTNAQTRCINSAITNITYSTTGATGATFSGLPSGVTGAWLANVATISGSPSATGTFNYTVTLTGGCGTITATGSIIVNAPSLVVNVSPSATVAMETPVTLTASGATSYVWSSGITNGVAFTPVATTTYTVLGTDVNGCTATVSQTITVNPSLCGPGSAWPNSRNLTISAATPSANYQVKVTLSAGQYTNIQAAGNDLRFTDGTNTPCNYWIESWNTSGTSTIWVNVVTTGTTALKMYFGNPSAPAGSNGDATFIFFDDFSGSVVNTLKWSAKNGSTATATVSGGQLTLNSGTVDTEGSQVIAKTGYAYAAGTMTESTLGTGGTTAATQCGSRASYCGVTSLSGNTSFFTVDNPRNSSYACWSAGRNGVVSSAIFHTGGAAEVYVGSQSVVTAGTKVGLSIENGRVEYFRSDISQGSSASNTPATTLYPVLNYMRFSCQPASNSTLLIDDIRVRKFLNTYNPTVSVGAISGATITAITATTACTSVSLTASGGTGYAWSGGATPTTAANTFTTSGTYTVTVTGANGCTSTAQQAIVVNAVPTISGVTGTTSICSGATTTLTAASAASSPVFKWYDATTGGTLLFTGAAYTTSALSANTTFYVDVTSNTCTSTRTAVTVSVTTINNQTVTASPTSLCASGTSTISLGSSQVGVNYTLRNNSNNAVIAGPTAGTGSAINFSTGTISSTTTYNVLAQTSNAGGTLDFDGADDYVAIPNSAALNLTALTIETWLYNDGNGNIGNVIMKGNYGYGYGVTSNGTIEWWDQFSQNAGPNSAAGVVPVGAWTHVAITVGAGQTKFYVNGVLNTTVAAATINNNTDPLYLGRQGHGCNCNFYNGKMDELRVWNTIRTQSEIQAAMNTPLIGSETGLVAYYKFDETAGTSASDSKSGNNGTLNNFTVPAAWVPGGINNSNATCNVQMTTTPTVTVNPLPTAAITGTATACTSVSLTATGGNSYAWSGGATPTTAANTFTTSGTYVVTVTGTGGCTATAQQVVVVNTLPTFTTCPTNITQSAAAGVCSAVVTYTAVATGTPAATISYTFTGATTGSGSGTGSGSTFNLGVTTVTLIANNTCGNSTACTFTVTVNDVTPPTIACAANVTINTTAGLCTGTTTLTAPTTTDNCGGISNNAMAFNGTSGFVTTPDVKPVFTTNTSRTIELWFNAASHGVILDERGQTPPSGGWQDSHIEIIPNGNVYVRVWSLGAVLVGNVAFNTWHHVVLRYDQSGGGRLDGFLDGVQSASFSPGGISSNTQTFYAIGLGDGQNLGSGAYFNGVVDEFRLWNTVRTSTEINNNKNIELTGSPAGLILYYKFNQGVAGGTNTGLTSVTDASGNGRTGTLANSLLTGTASNWVGSTAPVSSISLTNNAPATYPIGNTTVTWTATDAAGNTATCNQIVTVIAPEINVTGNSVSIVDGDATPSATDDTDFGNVNLNASVTRTFTIQNTGTSSLTVSTITSTGTNASNFVVGGITLPATVAAGASTTFTVTFTATALGTPTATITVNNSDCNEAAYDFAVQASVTCAPPVISISGTTTACNVVTLTASALGATAYAWSGGSSSNTAANTFSASGTYTVTVTGTVACTASASSVVTVNASPAAPVVSPASITACQNEAINLTIPAVVGGVNYTWSPAGTLFTNAAGTTAYVSGNSATSLYAIVPNVVATYTVTATSAAGCTSTGSATVNTNFASSNVILAPSTSATGAHHLQTSCEDANWTYYENPSNPGKYLFAINWNPNGGAALNATQKALTLNPGATAFGVFIDNQSPVSGTAPMAASPASYNTGNGTIGWYQSTSTSTSQATFAMQRYWNVNVGGGMLPEPVNVRFYFDTNEYDAVMNAATAWSLANGGYVEGPKWFKTVGAPDGVNNSWNPGSDLDPITVEHSGWVMDLNPLVSGYGFDNGIRYVQFNSVPSFSGGGLTVGVGSGSALPLELLYFTGAKDNGVSHLSWATATEINTSHFVVERSRDGINFAPIGQVAAAGNSNQELVYDFDDNAPMTGNNYYRLRMVDLDASYTYSNIINLTYDVNFGVDVFPNPFQSSVSVDIFTEQHSNSEATIELFDMLGRQVMNNTVSIGHGHNSFTLDNATLLTGTYTLKITSGSNVLIRKIVKDGN